MANAGSRCLTAASQGATACSHLRHNDDRACVPTPHRYGCRQIRFENELTGLVIRCVHRVFNTLGPGLPEGPYVRALAHECEKHGLLAQREVPIAVTYDGVIVGTFRADLVINRVLLVEVKACAIVPRHRAQTLTYLRCSPIELALLVSLDDRPVVKRFIIRNGVKRLLRGCADQGGGG